MIQFSVNGLLLLFGRKWPTSPIAIASSRLSNSFDKIASKDHERLNKKNPLKM